MRHLFITLLTFLSFIALMPILAKIEKWLLIKWTSLWQATGSEPKTDGDKKTSPQQTKNNSDRA